LSELWYAKVEVDVTKREWFRAYEQKIHNLVASLTPRRQRLLGAAICQELLPLIECPAVQSAIEVIEKFADTGKTKAALRRTRQSIQELRMSRFEGKVQGIGTQVLFVVQVAASENAISGTFSQAMDLVGSSNEVEEIQRRLLFALCDVTSLNTTKILQVISGQNPNWGFASEKNIPMEQRTPTVLALARQMYNSRDFSAMPILADALQDAGCDSEKILDHCRDPNGIHARGCWVIDYVIAGNLETDGSEFNR
jgi:hypothetical protein